MGKPQMPRVTEPDENMVHYAASIFSGSVTLCGLTDFIRAMQPGTATYLPVNCTACIEVRLHCESYAPHKDEK
jgi:hypothetical protein